MKKTLTTLLFLLVLSTSFAQHNIDLNFPSKVLNETRQISIHLPKSYNESDQKYPVIYSLDGEYTKYAISGAVDYYSFWDKIPECIVVSIDQNYLDTAANEYKRWLDCDYTRKTGLPEGTGISFKSFISSELIPYIDSTYRTTSFRTLVGHSFTANYVNYFILDDSPLFKGYISISPYYASNLFDTLQTKINQLESPILYFTASGERDISRHIKSVKEFDKIFSKVNQPNFVYKKFDMENNKATHATIVPIAISSAIEHVFSLYGSISREESKALLKRDDMIGYLKTRYTQIESIYGIKLKMREGDINEVSYALSKKKKWNQLKELGELVIPLYPESYMGYYILGEYEENMKNYAEALIQFEKGFDKLGSDVGNKSDFQIDIDRVKEKLKK